METTLELMLYERPRLSYGYLLRRSFGAFLTDSFFLGASRAAQLLPLAHPRLHDVEVEEDLPYREGGRKEHLLDLYRPKTRTGKLPVVLYLHGGGFRKLSRKTHWLFSLLFARRGYLVLNAEYRLAPRHPYPAAIDDACAAYCYAVREATRLGGDPTRVVLAGESAGANLVTSVALAASYRRPEPFAREVFDLGVRPAAVLPACGLFQVSDVERYSRRFRLSRFTRDRLAEVADAYLHGARVARHRGLDLADPLVALERGETPERPLPPFFVPCGTRDILIDDSRRLEAALKKLGVPCEARWYDREMHAFHAFVMRAAARRCWRDTFEFLDRHLPAPG
ncbi:MAG: alpha/beta hydrolase [Myxococcaceae bacterium]